MLCVIMMPPAGWYVMGDNDATSRLVRMLWVMTILPEGWYVCVMMIPQADWYVMGDKDISGRLICYE